MKLIIKVCGMTEAGNIRDVEALGVDFMGFIFYPKSPRCLCDMPGYMPVRARRVGVFVNESREVVQMVADRFSLDFVQLHGKESPEYCRQLRDGGLHLIKVFSVSQPEDLQTVPGYEGLCDYYFFDTKTPQYGGSGNRFDWNLLSRYDGNTPFLLSGGIDVQAAPSIRAFSHPRLAGIDLNSRFETSPGVKDVSLIKQFLSLMEE